MSPPFKRSLANLVKRTIGQLTARVKTPGPNGRSAGPAFLGGFLPKSGLVLTLM